MAAWYVSRSLNAPLPLSPSFSISPSLHLYSYLYLSHAHARAHTPGRHPLNQDSVLYGPGDLPSARPVFTGTTKHETKTSSEYQTLMKDLCCTDLGHRALHEIAVFFEEDYDRFPFPTRSVWGTGGMCDAVACPER